MISEDQMDEICNAMKNHLHPLQAQDAMIAALHTAFVVFCEVNVTLGTATTQDELREQLHGAFDSFLEANPFEVGKAH